MSSQEAASSYAHIAAKNKQSQRRRQSDFHVKQRSTAPHARRNTLMPYEMRGRSGIVGEQPATKPAERATPSKHRVKLPENAAQYYFSGLPKTPLNKALSTKKRHANDEDTASQETSSSPLLEESFDNALASYDGSLPAAQDSFLSMASSSSGESSGDDLLGKSVLSDTTELTASNFVLAANSRQRLSEAALETFRREKEEADKRMAAKENETNFSIATASAALPFRPPLGDKSQINQEGRKSMPPEAFAVMKQASAQDSMATQDKNSRRRTWQGSSPAYSAASSERGFKFAAQSREKRNQRLQARQGRLSAASSINTSFGDTSTLGSIFDGVTTGGSTVDLDTLTDAASLGQPQSSSAKEKSPDVRDLSRSDETVDPDDSLFDDLPSSNDSEEDTGTLDLDLELASGSTEELKTTESIAAESSSFDTSMAEQGAGSPQAKGRLPSSPNPSSSIAPADKSVTSPTKKAEEQSQSFVMASPPRRDDQENKNATSPYSKKLTPTKLKSAPMRMVDSPARNTRSHSKAKLQEDVDDEAVSYKRKRESLQDGALASLQAQRTPESKPGSVLKRRKSFAPSAMKSANSKKLGVALKVAFGSPQVARFNINSPSMSLTPGAMMPFVASSPGYGMGPSQRNTLPDDTVEIEADMNALFENNLPMNERSRAVNCSASTHEKTVELEVDMSGVLDNAGDDSDMSMESSIGPSPAQAQDEEKTVALDLNMNDLLDTMNPQGEDQTEDVSPSEVATAPLPQQKASVEEDVTVELEADMDALLSKAANTPLPPGSIAHNPVQEGEEEDSPLSIRSKRASVLSSASRSFSLTPRSKLSSDGRSIVDNSMENSAGDDSASLPSDPSSHDTSEETEEVPTLQVSDVLAITVGQDISDSIQDVLLEFGQSVQDCGIPAVFDIVNDFMGGVVEQLEDSQQPEDIDPDIFLKMTNEDREAILTLERDMISAKQSDAVKREIEKLGDNLGGAEGLQWSSWVLDVAEQMKTHVDNLADRVEAARESNQSDAKRLDIMQDAVATMESRLVQHARRKSLGRRKMNASTLEEEIRELEEQIVRTEGYLETAKSKNQSVAEVSKGLSLNSCLKKELARASQSSSASADEWTTVRAFVRWSPRAMTGDELSFSYVGPCPKGSIYVSFFLSPSLQCRAKVDPAVFPRHLPRNSSKLAPVMSFISGYTSRLCEKMSGAKIGASGDIGSFLRDSRRELERLEHTAAELSKLHRRYNASIMAMNFADDTATTYTLKVQVTFSRQDKPAKLRAEFAVSNAYPFAPLHSKLDLLEGHADLEELQDVLVRNAKPGFGYLSRTCDLITSYMS